MYARGGERPPVGTLTRLFFESLERFDRPDALQYRVGVNSWRPISHRTLRERVRRIALGLRELGVARGDRVAILSENRPEWALAVPGHDEVARTVTRFVRQSTDRQIFRLQTECPWSPLASAKSPRLRSKS